MTWNQVLNTLAVWRGNPAKFADPGVVEPLTDIALLVAWEKAIIYRSYKMPPPTRVVPDPNGGIVMEWEDGNKAREWHVDESGQISETTYSGGRIVR